MGSPLEPAQSHQRVQLGCITCTLHVESRACRQHLESLNT
jgi:hypothetical protein